MSGVPPSTSRLFSGRRFPLEMLSSIGFHISSLSGSPLLARLEGKWELRRAPGMAEMVKCGWKRSVDGVGGKEPQNGECLAGRVLMLGHLFHWGAWTQGSPPSPGHFRDPRRRSTPVPALPPQPQGGPPPP